MLIERIINQRFHFYHTKRGYLDNYMKVCIIVPNIPDNIPYLQYYIDLFDDNNIDFDILCWDRNNKLKEDSLSSNYYVFRKSGKESNPIFLKIYDFYCFTKYVIRHFKLHKYDYIIVCGIILAFYLRKHLLASYKNKYIFDIRDYSIILNYTRFTLNKLLQYSSLNVISSVGYLKWLPSNFEYILSHNVRKNLLLKSLEFYKDIKPVSSNNKTEILTIGQIRDFESNSQMITAFGFNDKVSLKFSGEGLDYFKIQNFAKRNAFNCFFTGKYKKNEEHLIVNNCDLINILLPEKDYIMTQMTNRFYLGILYRKPLIVNKKSIQYSFVKKYNLGFGADLGDDLNLQLSEYLSSFNPTSFQLGCEEIICDVLSDINFFERKILYVITPS
jgi:hypothetical protein